MTSKVFIPQRVKRFDRSSGQASNAFDFSAAAQFGQLTTILDDMDDPMFLALLTPKIREALNSFKEDDYLVAVGDPSVIAICSGIILRRQKRLNLLKWDRKLTMYIHLEVNP
jgi:hypothetical protein